MNKDNLFWMQAGYDFRQAGEIQLRVEAIGLTMEEFQQKLSEVPCSAVDLISNLEWKHDLKTQPDHTWPLSRLSHEDAGRVTPEELRKMLDELQ